MKKMKMTAAVLSAALLVSSCGSLNQTAKGGMIGGGGGAALGAIIGGIAGGGKGALIGASVGTAVGGTAGALIGRKMQKNAEAVAEIPGAQVQEVTDNNGLAAVQVTFSSGILFGFNSSVLSEQAKQSLSDLANVLKKDPTIDVSIVGHTDKVGTYEANMKVSQQRADAVAGYLRTCGVPYSELKTVEGVGYTQYNDSWSAAENRRVDIFMYASEQMIKNAEAGY